MRAALVTLIHSAAPVVRIGAVAIFRRGCTAWTKQGWRNGFLKTFKFFLQKNF